MKPKLYLLKYVFACMAMAFALTAEAQIQIIGPNYICSGDLANYKIKNNSGKSIQSYAWDFGDGHGSKLATPSYFYKKTGSYTLACEVVYADNSKDNASETVEVLELPKAIFTQANNQNNFCQFRANVCYQNNSTAAATDRPLQKTIITWGDGNLDVEKNKIPTKVCHNYEVVGDFKIRLEVVDSKGCKSADYKRINIIEGVKAQITSNTSVDCNSVEYCANAVVNPVASSYNWYFNGKLITAGTSNICSTYSKKTGIYLLLIAENLKTKCKDTAIVKDTVDVAPANPKLQFSSKNPCFNDTGFWIKTNSAINTNDINWYIDDVLWPDHSAGLKFNPKIKFLNPGKHRIRCQMAYGKCKVTLVDSIDISGPKAHFGIWNNLQCNSNYKVFFVDSSESKSAHCSWHWTSWDSQSDTCKIWRAYNKNRYKNCTQTLDWWGKHQFPEYFSGDVSLTVYDSTTGCSDSDFAVVYTGDCPPCMNPGAMRHLCQGDLFLNVRPNYFNPRYFSLDTGKTWLPFPSAIDKPYEGIYGVTFIVPRNFPNYAEDFGDDSFRVVQVPVIYDTVFLADYVHIHDRPSLDSISLSTTGCRDCKVVIHLNKHTFKSNEYLNITWKNKAWNFIFDKDTTIDSLVIQTHKKGGDSLIIQIGNKFKCSHSYSFYAGCGMDMEIEHDRTDCFENQHCVELKVRDNAADKYYDMQSGELNYKLKWSKNWYTNQNKLCKKISDSGQVLLQFICSNAHGCTDTMLDTIAVQKVVAGVSRDSKLAFCSELKKLFDSSYALGGDEIISSYGWNFNRRNRNSELKDPVQLFESGGKNHIIHWVTSSYGCRDTVEYDIEIAGSKPYFTIPDTMGCVEFDAVFKNKSKNCRTFIWEFGDPDQNIISVSDTQDVHFIYTAAGTYHINLIGIDTVYSPITGEAYHCHSYFPDNSDTNRTVHVLPYYKSSITAPDTICENEIFYVSSGTDDNAEYDNWLMPDGNKVRKTVKFSWKEQKKRGVYTYKIKPDYGWNPQEPFCADTPTKSVVVLGIDADFDYESKLNDGNYNFTNKSSLDAIRFYWNFGHSGNSKDTSTAKNPTHDYFPDTGNFKVCLVAKNAKGCTDTICKYVSQQYMEYCYLANVFTPENGDGKNDLYDVVISGEKQYSLRILNRFGELVYESKTDGDRFTDNINWNGKVRNTGATCPAGTYFYQFTWSYKRSPDKVRTVNGSVNLIR